MESSHRPDFSQYRAVAAPPPAPSCADFVEFGLTRSQRPSSSSAAVSARLEAIGLEVAQYVRTAFESAGETAPGMLGARTLENVIRVQTDFAKRSFDSFIEGGAKVSELGGSLVGASAGAWGASEELSGATPGFLPSAKTRANSRVLFVRVQ